MAERDLAERLLEVLEGQLAAKGLQVKRGTLVDATLIRAHNQLPTPENPARTGMRLGRRGLVNIRFSLIGCIWR